MDADSPKALQEMEAEVRWKLMSIILVLAAGVIILDISDAVEAAIVRHWKRTHTKRQFVKGGWKL